MIQRKTTRFLPFGAGLLALAGFVSPSADAEVISVNIFANNGQAPDTQLAASESAGVVSVDNWNNIGPFADNAGNATSGTLNDDDGSSTSATLSWTGVGATNTRSFADPADPDVRMMNSYSQFDSLTFNDLPSVFADNGFDLYVYYEDNNKGLTTTISATVGGTTFWGRDDTTYDDASDSYIRATALTEATATDANYFRFTGLTGSSVTVSFGGNGREPITGLQVVAIPEPASLALLGMGGLLMLSRRRREA